MNIRTLLYSVILSIGSASAGRGVAADESLDGAPFTSYVLQPGQAERKPTTPVRHGDAVGVHIRLSPENLP